MSKIKEKIQGIIKEITSFFDEGNTRNVPETVPGLAKKIYEESLSGKEDNLYNKGDWALGKEEWSIDYIRKELEKGCMGLERKPTKMAKKVQVVEQTVAREEEKSINLQKQERENGIEER